MFCAGDLCQHLEEQCLYSVSDSCLEQVEYTPVIYDVCYHSE